MTAANSTSPAPSRGGRWSGFVALLLVINLAGLAFLIQQTRAARRDVDARLAALHDRVRVMHFESTTEYGGSAFVALLDHLQYWAPWLQKGKPGTTDRMFVEKRMEDIVEAMVSLPGVFDQIEQAFIDEQQVAGDAAASDEMRKWLLRAAVAADRERGEDLLARVVIGDELKTTPRLRIVASQELLAANKQRAGEVLHELLNIRPTQLGKPGPNSRALRGQQVFNFIDHYVASGHPEVEKTLVRKLQETEYHETITIQRCVEALGKMKSRQAVNRIKKLYRQQAPVPGQVPNPIFRRKCIIAVVEILGQEAVPFLKEIDRSSENDPGIRAKLNEYKKQFDFSAK